MPRAKQPGKPLKRKPPGRYHHGDLRQELLRASRHIVAEDGIGALTFREVARRVGVSHAAPAHHFDDKAALLAAVAAEGFVELTQALSQALLGAGEQAVHRLNATGVAYVTYAAEHPNLFRLMFGRELAVCKDEEFVQSSARAYEVLDSASREVIREHGGADPAERQVVVAGAWSLVHGMSMLWLDGRLTPGNRSPDALTSLARRVTDLISRALLADPNQRSFQAV